ncbi:MAG: hypothetical protein ABR874_20580 [Candidatus Sulfotelmatobacter sp.]|jgi:hypothetical protein
MRFSIILCTAVAVLVCAASPQTATKAPPEPKSATVPITLDHDRVIIDVYVSLPDGSTKRIRAWVDNGDADLWMSQRVAGWMGLSISCDGQICTGRATPQVVSLEVSVGGMKIFLPAMRRIWVPIGDSGMVPGMSAEIKIPSSVLRNYDVLVDFPDREFSIGQPGSLNFKGVSSKMLVDASTGFIQIPSKIENKKYNLGLDLGSSISFLPDDLFGQLAIAHPNWPHMTGAVGAANMWGLPDEPKWRLMRLDRVQYGPLFLTDAPVVEFSKDYGSWFGKRAEVPTAGLLGAEALMNYRVGLDYAHSMVYFDIGRTFKFPDFDVVGLILRPEDDTRFTILGVADFEGKSSVPEVQAGDHLVAVDDIPVPDSTMGQVWSLLEGSPGQERKLTIERKGKHFLVVAKVQHFLGDSEEDQSKKSGKKK